MKKGFTLVELVVVIAIFGALFTVVSNTFVNALRAAIKAESTKNVRQNGDIAMTRIVNDIKSAQANSFQCLLETSGAAVGTNQNKRLIFTDADGIQWVYYRDASGALLRWREPFTPTSTHQYLVDRQSVWIPPDGTVTGSPNSLNFDCTNLNTSGAIQVELNIQHVPFGDTSLINSANSEEQIQMKFETTVVNRNS